MCQSLVIKAKLMQQRRVQVMNVYTIFDGSKAEFVGGAMNVSALDSSAGDAE